MPLNEIQRVGNDVIISTATTKDLTMDTMRKRIFATSGITAGGAGQLTILLTVDGTLAGENLFSTIDSVTATAIRRTTTAIQVPKVAIFEIAPDLKSVTFNVIVGTTINLLVTPTESFAPDGITVYTTIIGSEKMGR